MSEERNKQDFEIMYNALSVGWHLSKIAEVNKNILNEKENKERFEKWLGRHLPLENAQDGK